MKLRIKFGYRGMSLKNGRYYPKGEYELEDDIALKNRAQYLVDNGHAEYVGEYHTVSTTVVDSDVDEIVVKGGTTFTNQAIAVFNQYNIDPENTHEYFGNLGINHVTKSLAVDYVESLD